MTDFIVCSTCSTKVQLSDAMARQLEVELQQRFAAELAARMAEARVQAERATAAAIAGARGELADQLRARDEALARADKKLAEQTQREVALLRRARELDEREQQAALELERRLVTEREQLRATLEATLAERVRLATDEAHRLAAEQHAKQQHDVELRAIEHRQQIDGLQRTVTSLQQRLTQTSQQAQGEAQEEALRTLLQRACPHDEIDEVPLGKNGADLLHKVMDGARHAGTILWEAKRTKTWSDAWLPKLRDDQRCSKAEWAVLVTQTMPADIKLFGEKDGVWIVAMPYVSSFTALLRDGIVKLASARSLADNQTDKMSLLYRYMTGPDFHARLAGLVDGICRMEQNLVKEQQATKKFWKAREGEIQAALDNLLSVQADLRRIGGPTVTAIAELDEDEVLALPEPEGAATRTKTIPSGLANRSAKRR